MPASANNAGARDPGFGVYVHWPFCAAICPYCDFNRHLADNVEHDLWRRALISEIEWAATETPGRTVASVFFGGGTPGLMEPDTVAAVLGAVARGWAVADDLEVTLEANPSSAEAGRFRAFRDAGVNRLSLGVQSFEDARLRFLGRRHSADEARDAIVLADGTFPRVSFDLIAGLPGDTGAAWGRELDQALALASGHLSVYQLTIEPGTPFHRDGIKAADADTGADLDALTREKLAGAGLVAYEISNYARPGQECRHNLAIWRGGDYAAIGPGAHGRITKRAPGSRTEALYRIHDPGRWLDAVARKGHGTAKRETLALQARAEEAVMTGLRLGEGIDGARFQSVTGCALDDVIDGDAAQALIRGGFLERDAGGLRATAAGRLRLDSILPRLLAR